MGGWCPSLCLDRVQEWNVDAPAVKACLEGKVGEYRKKGVHKATDGKVVYKKGDFKVYEYIRIRLGYSKARQGQAFGEEVDNACILYEYNGAESLRKARMAGGRKFVSGDWLCKFGRVVEWCGLYDLCNRPVGIRAGITPLLVQSFVDNL